MNVQTSNQRGSDKKQKSTRVCAFDKKIQISQKTLLLYVGGLEKQNKVVPF